MRVAVVVQPDEAPQVSLQLACSQQWLFANKLASLRDVAALVSRDLLQATLNGFVPTFNMRVVVGLPTSIKHQIDPEHRQKRPELLETKIAPWSQRMASGSTDGIRCSPCRVEKSGATRRLPASTGTSRKSSCLGQTYPPPITDRGALDQHRERPANVIEQQPGLNAIRAPGNHTKSEDYPGRNVNGGDDLDAACAAAQWIVDKIVGAGDVDGDDLAWANRWVVFGAGDLTEFPALLRTRRGPSLPFERSEKLAGDPLGCLRSSIPFSFKRTLIRRSISSFEMVDRSPSRVSTIWVATSRYRSSMSSQDLVWTGTSPVDQGEYATLFEAADPASDGDGAEMCRSGLTVLHPPLHFPVELCPEIQLLGHLCAALTLGGAKPWTIWRSRFAGPCQRWVAVAVTGQYFLNDFQASSVRHCGFLIEAIPEWS